MREVVADVNSKDPLENQLEGLFEEAYVALKDLKTSIQVVSLKIELEAHDVLLKSLIQESNGAESRLDRIIKRVKNVFRTETSNEVVSVRIHCEKNQ